jgi:hypothetical protein
MLDEKILNELRDVERRFSNEEYMLDLNVIRSSPSIRVERFEREFPEAMAEFRRLDLDHESVSDHYDYSQICKKFHDLVMIGKANNIIIKRATQQELNRLKDRCHFLESKERESDSKTKQLEDELTKLNALIESVTRVHPFLKPFFNIQEGEVEEKDEQPS